MRVICRSGSIPVKIISRSHRSLSSVQDSVHGFITQLQKVFFDALELLKFSTICRTLLKK